MEEERLHNNDPVSRSMLLMLRFSLPSAYHDWYSKQKASMKAAAATEQTKGQRENNRIESIPSNTIFTAIVVPHQLVLNLGLASY